MTFPWSRRCDASVTEGLGGVPEAPHVKVAFTMSSKARIAEGQFSVVLVQFLERSLGYVPDR